MKILLKNNESIRKSELFQSTLFGLDLQAHTFLTHYYNTPIPHQKALETYLTCWQYEALLTSLIRAKKYTPFYKKHLDATNYLALLMDFQTSLQKHIAQNILPDKNNINQQLIDLLTSLPKTSPHDIVQNADSFLAISQDDIEGIISVKTSGSSSNTRESTDLKRIYCSASDLKSTVDFYFYGMENVFMGNFDQRVAMLMSGERIGNVGHLMKCAMDRKNIPCEIIGFSYDYDDLIKKLIEFQPTCIIAIPWHIFALSQQIAYFTQEHLKNSCSHLTTQITQLQQLRSSVTSILLSGDTCCDTMKTQLSQNFDCPVFRHYGMTEFGLGGSVECKEHKAMHIRGLDTIIEILPYHEYHSIQFKNSTLASTLDITNIAKFGEIVITSLTREAMPLLRYRTGDFGRFHKKCSCNSIMQQLEVLGRPEQGLLLNNTFIHLSDMQKIFCTIPLLQDFDMEVKSIQYKNKSNFILIFKLRFLNLLQVLEKKDFEHAKENVIAQISTQISNLFSLQYIEKKAILEGTNNREENKTYTPHISLNYFSLFEQNTEHKELNNPQFPKKKIYF